MADRQFLASQAYKDQQHRALRHYMTSDGQLVGAHPDIVEFERVFVRRMGALGVPVFAHNMLRDGRWQDMLEGLGKSKTTQSPHEFGFAVDIVHSGKAWSLTPEQWAVFGHVGKEVSKATGIKVTWGGDWKFYDPAHWQLASWAGQPDLYPFPRLEKWQKNWRKVLGYPET